MGKFRADPTGPEPTVSTSFLPPDRSASQSRNRFLRSKTILTAVFVSLLCGVLAIVSITPSIHIAWRLRFTGQIVVVGFLLSVMNACLQHVLTFAFLLIEVRFGRSRLQNLDAIASGKPTVAGVSTLWRVTLVGFLVLPLGLSVAYKKFLGGGSGVYFTPTSPGLYGPAISTGEHGDNFKADFFSMSLRATDAIRTLILSENTPFPTAENLPQAYGYNTLLMSNETVAVLDMPANAFVTDLQGMLHVGDSLEIFASVEAWEAAYNHSTTALRTEDDLWSDVLRSQNPKSPLETVYMYDELSSRFGYSSWIDNSQILIGLYYNTTIPENYWRFDGFGGEDDDETNRFRNQTHLYSIRRVNCHGHWHVNTTSTALLDGNCDDSPASSSLLSRLLTMDGSMHPWSFEFLPTATRMIPYTRIAGADNWEWLPVMHAVTIATGYFSRSPNIISARGWDPYYQSSDEKIIINRLVMRAEWLLYLVLVVQPALTVLGFMVIIWLHKTPISKDFGITAVVSQLSPDSLDCFQGPGLADKLKRPLQLEVDFKPESPPGESRATADRIQYTLRPGPKS